MGGGAQAPLPGLKGAGSPFSCHLGHEVLRAPLPSGLLTALFTVGSGATFAASNWYHSFCPEGWGALQRWPDLNAAISTLEPGREEREGWVLGAATHLWGVLPVRDVTRGRCDSQSLHKGHTDPTCGSPRSDPRPLDAVSSQSPTGWASHCLSQGGGPRASLVRGRLRDPKPLAPSAHQSLTLPTDITAWMLTPGSWEGPQPGGRPGPDSHPTSMDGCGLLASTALWEPGGGHGWETAAQRPSELPVSGPCRPSGGHPNPQQVQGDAGLPVLGLPLQMPAVLPLPPRQSLQCPGRQGPGTGEGRALGGPHPGLLPSRGPLPAPLM